MSRFMSLDKQLENLAKKWYIKKYYENQIMDISNKNLKKEFLKKIDNSLDMKKIINEYLKENPEMKKQYKAKKQRINKIKTMAGLGILTLAVGTGVYAKTYKEVKTEEPTKIETQIDYGKIEKTAQEIGKEKEYTQFFEKIKNISKVDEKEKEIVNFTKQKIVETYNTQNPENQITIEQLQYFHLNETVLANKDVFGNDVSYERISQRDMIETKSNQELKKISGGLYEFKVDEKTVAVYDANGQEIIDSNIQNNEKFFGNTIDLVKNAEKLQDMYKYKSNDTEIKQIENKYESAVKNLQKNTQDSKQIEENVK